MYESFYGLKEKPFQIAPNPSYLYMSSIHDNALTYLEYGLMENVGFILLTGEVGTGKTTLVRHIMDQFESQKNIAVIFNTNVSANELIFQILQSYELKPLQQSKTKNIETFYQFLIEKYAQNKPVLLIIDEAQNLSDKALEEVRMLSNLQSDDKSLIQIMLVGQPELKDRLLKPGHGAFAQRIAVNFFLSGLNEKETKSYIFHRLKKAGGNPNIFSPKAIEMIFQASKGIPRTINLLCDTALVYGFGYDFETIDAPVIEQVIKDKGGMGLIVESDENKKIDGHRNKFKTHKNSALALKKQVDGLKEKVDYLEEKIKRFEKDLDVILKILLFEERKRNDHLLKLYNELKAQYDSLLGR